MKGRLPSLIIIESIPYGVQVDYADASVVAARQLKDLLDTFMVQVAVLDLEKERRLVTRRQIDSFNRANFDYPMDTATSFAKGVYATAEDFWKNAPSITNYSIDTDKSGHSELNIPDATGKMYYTHTVWGFCDGAQRYAMMDGNLFPIFLVGHQFYVLGSKEYHKRQYTAGVDNVCRTGKRHDNSSFVNIPNRPAMVTSPIAVSCPTIHAKFPEPLPTPS